MQNKHPNRAYNKTSAQASNQASRNIFRAALVQHVISTLENPNPPSTTRIQRTAYFLQEVMGINAGFRFRMHYGSPSSEQVESAISRLKAAAYISIHPNPEYRSLDWVVQTTHTPRPTGANT